MQRIDERVESIFGVSGLPRKLTFEQFAALAAITPEQLTQLIEAGSVEGNLETREASALAYLRFACEKNLRESGEDEEHIAHVLDCLR